MKKYDIVIVGAGPAGLTLARELDSDNKILIIDKKPLPRNKPCGGILVEESVKEILPLNPPNKIFSVPKHLDLKLIDIDNGYEIVQKRGFVNVNRFEFDKWLLDLISNKNNIEIMDKTEIVSFSSINRVVEIIIKKNGEENTINCKYLIGADGAFSFVRRKLFNHNIRFYVTYQEFIKMEIPDNLRFVNFIFYNNLTDFYSWLIPKNDYLLVGTAIKPGIGTNEKVKMFKKFLLNKYGISNKFDKHEAYTGLRPESISDIVLGKENILLCGESSGLISPSTGDGISFALRSAKLCAKSINENKRPLEKYKVYVKPLIHEIEKKIHKSETIMDPKKRLIMQKKMVEDQNI